MMIFERFDHPIPSLGVGIDAINIETKDRHEGNFTIKNLGGGVLSGKILSRCPGLVFTPTQWEGNRQTITYTFNATAAGLATGQGIEGHVFVSSNGGETKIPVTARLAKMSIATAEGNTIANLQDFYEYAQTHPANARRMFVDSEFYMLLLALGYEYMEVYESLHKDSNRERALDNFFILSGLKGKTTMFMRNKGLEFVQKPYDTSMLYGSITVQKSDMGYIEAAITTKNNSPWLNFYASRLIQSDFDEDLTAVVNFSIDPLKVYRSYARELVNIGPDNTIEIEYRRTAPVILRLNRIALRYEDSGVIEVINNTGSDVRIEVFCPESFVRFSAKSYLVGEYGEIPFDVKPSAFLSAQLFFRKLPYMKTAIEIKAMAPGLMHNKQIPLIVGEW